MSLLVTSLDHKQKLGCKNSQQVAEDHLETNAKYVFLSSAPTFGCSVGLDPKEMSHVNMSAKLLRMPSVISGSHGETHIRLFNNERKTSLSWCDSSLPD